MDHDITLAAQVVAKRCRMDGPIMAPLIAANPHLRGAHFADALAMVDDSDGAIQWTEPFFEVEHETVANIHVWLDMFGIEPGVQTDIIRLAAVTEALYRQEVPTTTSVVLLAALIATEVLHSTKCHRGTDTYPTYS